MAVRLHVYHLGKNVAISVLNNVFGRGAYHSGVEVFGKEWSYGLTFDPTSTGVTWDIPREHPDHTFYMAIDCGVIRISEYDFDMLV